MPCSDKKRDTASTRKRERGDRLLRSQKAPNKITDPTRLVSTVQQHFLNTDEKGGEHGVSKKHRGGEQKRVGCLGKKRGLLKYSPTR